MDRQEALNIISQKRWNCTSDSANIAKILIHIFNGTLESTLEEDKQRLNPSDYEYYVGDKLTKALLALYKSIDNFSSKDEWELLIQDLAFSCREFNISNAKKLLIFAEENNKKYLSLLSELDNNFRGNILAIEIAGDFGYVKTSGSAKDGVDYYPIGKGYKGCVRLASSRYSHPAPALIHSIIEQLEDSNAAMHLTYRIWRMIMPNPEN